MEVLLASDGKLHATNELLDGHYKLMRQLNDKNATVAVWLARDVNTIDNNASANDESSGHLVSIVMCHPTTTLDIDDEQHWQDEFDAAHECHHPNLLPPNEYNVIDETYYLVFPYNKAESLSQFIRKPMSEKMTWKLISDIASGLNELHTYQPQIIHNDIKPSNILVLDQEDFVLTNYGIHFETDRQRIDKHTDSLAYMAPERFQGASVPRPESDIWAFGAILYEALSGNKPFGEQGGKNQRHDSPMPPLPNQPAEIRELIYACLQADPKKRPTAQKIKDATRSKKTFIKQRKKNHPDQTKQHSSKDNHNKRWPVAIAAAALLLIGVMAFILIPRHHDDNNNNATDIAEEKANVASINYYEMAVSLLSDKNTAANGRELLDSLANANDWKATFLLSRLYFDTRENDTVFYDYRWGMMRDNCDIIPDNEMAHKYLFDAFALKENDFMILYQLGCDFKAGTVRGCERNLDYALWCFDHAENALKNSSVNRARYQQELERGRDRISTLDHAAVKPSR